MSCTQVDTGRYRVDLGGGLAIEIVLLYSRTLAFWMYGGSLVAELAVGDG